MESSSSVVERRPTGAADAAAEWPGPDHRRAYGLYQIGDVYARSWSVAGTLSGRLMPK
jgi:hypothetical protein